MAILSFCSVPEEGSVSLKRRRDKAGNGHTPGVLVLSGMNGNPLGAIGGQRDGFLFNHGPASQAEELKQMGGVLARRKEGRTEVTEEAQKGGRDEMVRTYR